MIMAMARLITWIMPGSSSGSHYSAHRGRIASAWPSWWWHSPMPWPRAFSTNHPRPGQADASWHAAAGWQAALCEGSAGALAGPWPRMRPAKAF